MIVAFKKGYHDLLSGNWWIALGIMVRTCSIYTHCELQFSDGYCITASSAINDSTKDGVDIRPLDVSGPEWDRIRIDITKFGWKSEAECRAKAEYYKNTNKGYAIGDLWKHELFGEKIKKGFQFYCSGIVACLLKRKPILINPGELYSKLMRLPHTCIA